MTTPTTVIGRDVPLPDGWVLRVAHDTSRGVVHLAPGEGRGEAWRERPDAGGLTVPVGAVEELQRALTASREG